MREDKWAGEGRGRPAISAATVHDAPPSSGELRRTFSLRPRSDGSDHICGKNLRPASAMGSETAQPPWLAVGPQGWSGLQKNCALPETLWFVGVIFRKKLQIYCREGELVAVAKRGQQREPGFSPPRARTAPHTHSHSALSTQQACTPAPGWPNPIETDEGGTGGFVGPSSRGCRPHRRHGSFWPCRVEARVVDDAKLVPKPRVRARMCTLPHGRPNGVPKRHLVRSRRLLHGRIWPWSTPTVPQPRWSGISFGQEPFGPCRAQSMVGCSAKCPVWVPECARCPMGGLKGCPEALWCDRVDFCTGGLGRGRPRPCHSLVGRGFPSAKGRSGRAARRRRWDARPSAPCACPNVHAAPWPA